MNPQKVISCFLAFMLITAGLTFAQSSTKPNPQQERYDEHHGIKAKTSTFTPETPDSQRKKTQRSDRQTDEPAASTEPDSPNMAPASRASGVRIGVRGGVTYPVYTQKVATIDPSLGFVGGLTFNFGQGVISFQPEVNYTRYAFKVDDGFGTIDARAADLIEVPLFLKISSGTYAGNRFFLNVGPYASYVASESIAGKKVDVTKGANRFGFGAAAGVGTALKAGPGHVTIEVRGLYPLGDFDNGFSTDANVIYGQAAVGYIFPLGGR